MNQPINSNYLGNQARANGVTWGRATPETYMELEMLGKKHCCLLDTGCDYSLIPRRLVPTATLTPVHVNVYAANGTRINILSGISVQFRVAGHTLTADLLVSEDIHQLMLGYDWLTAQGANWDFKDKKLFIQNTAISLRERKSLASVSRVFVRGDVIVYPNTEQNVPVKGGSLRFGGVGAGSQFFRRNRLKIGQPALGIEFQVDHA